ncbi:uncharacterized protein [Antedon mediterranea]|uniref:uncharacterized protein n=1 Tax=Antedon mediterranea TaxID=105859 RepID=UPI003AF981B0
MRWLITHINHRKTQESVEQEVEEEEESCIEEDVISMLSDSAAVDVTFNTEVELVEADFLFTENTVNTSNELGDRDEGDGYESDREGGGDESSQADLGETVTKAWTKKAKKNTIVNCTDKDDKNIEQELLQFIKSPIPEEDADELFSKVVLVVCNMDLSDTATTEEQILATPQKRRHVLSKRHGFNPRRA